MKEIMFRMLPVLAIALIVATVSGVASAQNDVFTTNYYSNNTTPGAPAGTLRISNDGAAVLAVTPQTLCANIYVFAADQQLTECCSCPVTPNGLIEENIKTDLLGNPLTRVTPNEGVIQILSTVDTGSCDAALVLGSTLGQGLFSWTTHIENKVGSTFPVSVTQNSPANLSAAELAALDANCSLAQKLGSGFGICRCNPEAVK